jgi:hypothetical protein
VKRDVPPRYRPLYERAMSGKSRKAAIAAFCLECVGWSLAEVRRCTAPNCPLFPYVRRGFPSAGSTRRGRTPIGTGQNVLRSPKAPQSDLARSDPLT